VVRIEPSGAFDSSVVCGLQGGDHLVSSSSELTDAEARSADVGEPRRAPSSCPSFAAAMLRKGRAFLERVEEAVVAHQTSNLCP
jgi:hypothetical protein